MQPLNDQQLQELRVLILKEQKISAIGKYREMTGVGLAEAKDAIEALHARMRMQGTQLQTGPQLAGAQLEEIQALILRNEKISAITKYREMTGASLVDAKQTVENIHANMRRENPHLAATSKKSGCASVLVATVLIVATLSFLIFH